MYICVHIYIYIYIFIYLCTFYFLSLSGGCESVIGLVGYDLGGSVVEIWVLVVVSEFWCFSFWCGWFRCFNGGGWGLVFGVSILFGCQLLWLVGFVFRWLVGFIVRLDSDDFGRVCVLSSSFFFFFFFFSFFFKRVSTGNMHCSLGPMHCSWDPQVLY